MTAPENVPVPPSVPPVATVAVGLVESVVFTSKVPPVTLVAPL